MFHTEFDEKTKLWKGLDLPPLYNPKASVGQILLNALSLNGSKIAQISDDSGVELTFNDIREKTIRAALNLRKRGYKPKEIFGFMALNSHDLVPIVLASFCLGCPFNPIYTNPLQFNTTNPDDKAEIKRLMNNTKPKLMFCDINLYDFVKECLIELGNDAKIITFGGQKGDSESVENLFIETGEEATFV